MNYRVQNKFHLSGLRLFSAQTKAEVFALPIFFFFSLYLLKENEMSSSSWRRRGQVQLSYCPQVLLLPCDPLLWQWDVGLVHCIHLHVGRVSTSQLSSASWMGFIIGSIHPLPIPLPYGKNVTKLWHRDRRGCGISSSEIIRSNPDTGLGHSSGCPCWGRAEPKGPRGPCQPQPSCDSVKW